jgi:hypothetical protein
MIEWRNLPGEHTELYSPVGLRPVDEITSVAPLGKVRVYLDIKDGNGGWQITGIKPVITPGGVITFPGLERRAEVAGQPPRRYRIRLDAELYRPLYPARTAGYEFKAFPYNDANPPQNIASDVLITALLTPATNYPFPTHILVLRGNVRDSTDLKVADVLVSDGTTERVLTDERGEFAFPLRWVKKSPSFPIVAEDRKSNRKGMITIKIPEGLGKNHTIRIS